MEYRSPSFTDVHVIESCLRIAGI